MAWRTTRRFRTNAPYNFDFHTGYRKTWYTKAIAYWENNEEVPATVDGVLGGFAVLDAPDVRASRRFLGEARKVAGQQGGAFAAADVGSCVDIVRDPREPPRHRADPLTEISSRR